MGVFDMCTVMYEIKLFSSVFSITKRRHMGLYEVSLAMPLFWDGGYVSRLPYV